MAKILVLGDIHGRLIWNDIIEKENPDLTIFLGDYISSHDDITEEQQLANLEDILNYKEENPDKVILLRGNHDISIFPWGRCYPQFFRVDLFPTKRFEKDTQWAYMVDNILFSHAGVSKTFLERNKLTIEELINLKKFDDSRFRFTADRFSDNYGESKCQPPTWIRPWTLREDILDGYTQIVGHTVVEKCLEFHGEDWTLWCCDALGEKSYLVIDNNEFKVKEL